MQFESEPFRKRLWETTWVNGWRLQRTKCTQDLRRESTSQGGRQGGQGGQEDWFPTTGEGSCWICTYVAWSLPNTIRKRFIFSSSKVSQVLWVHPKNKPVYNNLSSTGTQEAVARAREESGDALNIVVIKEDNNYDVGCLEGTKITKVSPTLYHIKKADDPNRPIMKCASI